MASVFSKPAKQRIRRAVRAVEGTSKGERFGRRDLLLESTSSVKGFTYFRGDGAAEELSIPSPNSDDAVDTVLKMTDEAPIKYPSSHSTEGTLNLNEDEFTFSVDGDYKIEAGTNILAEALDEHMAVYIRCQVQLGGAGSWLNRIRVAYVYFDSINDTWDGDHWGGGILTGIESGDKMRFAASYTQSGTPAAASVYAFMETIYLTKV